MENELRYEDGQPFYYQIGEVSTILPWWRPNYDRICRFLTQEEVSEIFSKYADVEIIGNCLWDFDVTWDVDIRLILDPRNSILKKSNYWDSVEDDINKLNHLALNEWRLLLDVGVCPDKHSLPTRKQVLDAIDSGNEDSIKVDESWIGKISYTRKVVGDKSFDFDINTTYNTEPMSSRYLTKYYPDFHKKKIIDKIRNSKKEYLENAVSIDVFLSMGEEEFIKFQNY